MKHARVNISRQAGGFFGKFQVEGSAQATNLDIYTDGDRFMDVDPCTFTGIIADNRIYVTVTEGQNGSDEGVLELRGLDIDELHCDPCDPNVLLVCQIDSGTMPAFDTNTWTLEQLEVAAGAKVTLMDRFSSGNGNPEVLYVKNIVLGAGCVLNVGLERLYYTNLSGDPNLIKVDALLGISLDKMDCDSNEEFEKRISNNNPTDPNDSRIYVERVVGLEPDPNGMMKMSYLKDPNSGQIISARAKGEFAPAAEEKLWVRFNYLFTTSDPNAQIVAYLSDVPEMLDLNDPCRDAHYIEVARISAPPWPRPGSAGSGRFGNFEEEVMTGEFDLTNGTWVELELNEPGSGSFFARGDDYKQIQFGTLGGGGSAYVDDVDVKAYCCWGYCLDLNWDLSVTEADFLKVVGDVGKSDSDTPCKDGAFGKDGYVDTYDIASWDWTLNLDARKNLCMLVPLSGGGGFSAGSGFGNFGGPRSLINPSDLNDLLIAGKRGTTADPTKLMDRLYVFDALDSNAAYLRWLEPNPPSNRCNIKVVRGEGNDLYRINSQDGVSRLDGTDANFVPAGGHTTYTPEPRYGRLATVYVGVQGTGSNPSGRPILDAAFDADANFVYVVPVVVVSDGNAPYAAAAKLKLKKGSNPPYDVNKLYDGPLLPGDNQRKYRNTLRDIKLDGAGNVYVTNAHVMNESDILWKFEPNGTVRRLNLGNPTEVNYVPAPMGMCVSSTTNVVYLASSSFYGKVDPDSTVIHGFSTADFNLVRTITVHRMQHMTGITEDPVTKSLWVAGFDMNSTANPPKPFYDPYLAKVPSGVNDVCAVCILGANDLAMPLSIVWTGARPVQKKCGGADLNGSGTVNLSDLAKFAQYWLCAAPSYCDGADLEPEQSPDGDVDIWDLDVLAEHWLNTGCN